jgi:hypothetical protein
VSDGGSKVSDAGSPDVPGVGMVDVGSSEVSGVGLVGGWMRKPWSDPAQRVRLIKRLADLRSEVVVSGPREFVENAIFCALASLQYGPPPAVDPEDHLSPLSVTATNDISLSVKRKLGGEYFRRRTGPVDDEKHAPNDDAVDCPAVCLRRALLDGVLYSVLPLNLLAGLRWLMWKKAGKVDEDDIIELCSYYLAAHQRIVNNKVWRKLGRVPRLILAHAGFIDIKELVLIVGALRVRFSSHPCLVVDNVFRL